MYSHAEIPIRIRLLALSFPFLEASYSSMYGGWKVRDHCPEIGSAMKEAQGANNRT